MACIENVLKKMLMCITTIKEKWKGFVLTLIADKQWLCEIISHYIPHNAP